MPGNANDASGEGEKPTVKPDMRLILILLSASLLFIACDGKDEKVTSLTASPEPSVIQPTLPPTPLVLTEYDPGSKLLVEGRDHFRACIETLTESVAIEDAAHSIERGLMAASADDRWPEEFGRPQVDVGCPLAPVAITDVDEQYFARVIERAQADLYLIYIFVAEPSLLLERFGLEGGGLLSGVRRANQEALLGNQVAESWYLTPDELGDSALLVRYVFGIFHIGPQGR